MKNSRRRFIKQVSHEAIGTWVLSTLPKNTAKRYIITNDEQVSVTDEQFWRVVRDQFPLSHDRVYFNNGTIGPSPYPVIEAVRQTMLDLDTRGEYDGWETARPKLAKFVNVDISEISLTHNVTEGINIVAQ